MQELTKNLLIFFINKDKKGLISYLNTDCTTECQRHFILGVIFPRAIGNVVNFLEIASSKQEASNTVIIGSQSPYLSIT